MYVDVEVDFILAQTCREPPSSLVCWWLDKEIWGQSGVADGGEQRPLSGHKSWLHNNIKHYSAFVNFHISPISYLSTSAHTRDQGGKCNRKWKRDNF